MVVPFFAGWEHHRPGRSDKTLGLQANAPMRSRPTRPAGARRDRPRAGRSTNRHKASRTLGQTTQARPDHPILVQVSHPLGRTGGMDPALERAIAERARTQLGLITTTQLIEAGLSTATITRRRRRGLLLPVGRRTCALAGVPLGPTTHVMALCLDYDAVASHRTAAWLHGLDARPERVDVTVRRGRSSGLTPTMAKARVHTSTNLPPDDITSVGSIPTTSVARTLMGLAALDPSEVSDEHLLGLVEEAVRRRLASDRWLWWLLEQRRCRGRDGVTRFEGVLATRGRLGPTESWLEREVLRIVAEAGLPRPEVQRKIRRRGAFVARVDFAYPAEMIVLEALGYRSHASREQQSADAARASELQLMGYDVHQVTYDQVVRRPAWLVHVVRTALARSSARAA